MANNKNSDESRVPAGACASLSPIRVEDLLPCAEITWQVGSKPRTEQNASEPWSEEETTAHLAVLQIPSDGIDYVVSALKAPPSRKVSNAYRSNRVGEVHSFVQAGFQEGATAARLQFESSYEHDFVICLSANTDLHFLIDQPTTVFAPWTTSGGGKQHLQHTPDYLAVFTASVVAYEIKPLLQLIELASERPEVWSYEGGVFTHMPAQRHFEQLGIKHQIVPAETIPWIYAENLRILSSYAVQTSDEQWDQLLPLIKRTVSKTAPTSLALLSHRLGCGSGPAVLRAMLDGHIFVDLQHCSLWHPDNMVICGSEAAARQVALAVVSLEAESMTGEDTAWIACPPKHLPLFGQRVALVKGLLDSDTGSAVKFSLRTRQRLKKLYAEHGLVALVPGWDRCGSGSKFSREERDFAESRIALDRSSSNHVSTIQSYAKYKLDLEDAAKKGRFIKRISETVYYAMWRARRHNRADAYGVGGKRKANADAPYGDPRLQKPMCTLPMQVAHVDHCSLPVICEESDDPPKLSCLVDHLSAEVLAGVLRTDQGSMTTLGLLLRQCARNHAYLPKVIYRDGGSDLASVNFLTALAELGVSSFKRPAADGRRGSEIERFHSTIQTTVVKGGPGYKPSVKSLRGTSSSHYPQNLPRRKLAILAEEVNIALRMLNDGSAYGESGTDLVAMRKKSEEVFGPQGVPCEVNFKLYVNTSVFIKNPTGKTDMRGAIRLGSRRYHSPLLVGRKISVASLFPRMDIESADTIVYFWLNRRWNTAICREHLTSAGRTIESILAEAALACDNRGDTRDLAPLHLAIEQYRRLKSNEDSGAARPEHGQGEYCDVVAAFDADGYRLRSGEVAAAAKATDGESESAISQSNDSEGRRVDSEDEFDDWDNYDASHVGGSDVS